MTMLRKKGFVVLIAFVLVFITYGNKLRFTKRCNSSKRTHLFFRRKIYR